MHRDRHRRGHDRGRVAEHREQRDQHEEVEVHLDLHRALPEVDQQAAHHHRREAVRHGERAGIA